MIFGLIALEMSLVGAGFGVVLGYLRVSSRNVDIILGCYVY